MISVLHSSRRFLICRLARRLFPLLAAGSALVLFGLLRCHSTLPQVPLFLARSVSGIKTLPCGFHAVVPDEREGTEVRFAWGDGDTADWSDVESLGETLSVEHCYAAIGAFCACAQARNGAGLVSGWSVPCSVSISEQGTTTSHADLRIESLPSAPILVPVSFVAYGSDTATGLLSLRIAFGDGDTSSWSGWMPGPCSLVTSYTYGCPGTYDVRAQARIWSGVTSEWSEARQVTISSFSAPGTPRWALYFSPVNLTALTSPAIAADGTLFLTLSEGGAYAVAPNGDLKWACERYEYGASSVSIASDSTLCFWDYINGGNLDDIDPDGAVKWQAGVLCDPYGLSCAIGQNGNLYVPTYNESLVAIGADGVRRWQHYLHDGYVAAPAVGADGTVYIAGTSGHLTAVDPQGNMIWQVPTATGTTSPLAIASDGTIYDPAGDSLFAVKPDGTIAWRFATDGLLGFGPAIGADSTVYFGSSGGTFYALTPQGNLKWAYDAGGPSVFSPAVAADGTVYIGAANGLHAVNSEGSRIWLWPTSNLQSSPVIGPDGTVYITANFWLFALNGTAPLANSPWPMFQHDLQHTGRAQ